VQPIVTRLKIDQIPEEVSHHTLRPDEAWIEGLELGGDARFAQPLTIDLDVHRVGAEVFVQGRLTGRLLMPCSRCLERADVAFEQPFQAVYLPAPEADRTQGGEPSIGPGDPARNLEGDAPDSEDVFHHVRGWLDLAPMLREQLLLAIPARALCKEDCRGLCPNCGTNLNLAECGCPGQQGFSKFEKLRGLT
jgi:uncharacterized protein